MLLDVVSHLSLLPTGKSAATEVIAACGPAIDPHELMHQDDAQRFGVGSLPDDLMIAAAPIVLEATAEVSDDAGELADGDTDAEQDSDAGADDEAEQAATRRAPSGKRGHTRCRDGRTGPSGRSKAKAKVASRNLWPNSPISA